MSTHLHNKMDVEEGYAYYRYGIYDDINHKRKNILIENVCMTKHRFIMIFYKLIKFNIKHEYYYIECYRSRW